ncbi:MAG: PhoH family protein, partial [Burkholderiaceae bacterium]
MPLPKLPTKPAALLSPQEYPKAEQGKPVKPHMQLIETPAKPVPVEAVPVSAPVARSKVVESVRAERSTAPKQ